MQYSQEYLLFSVLLLSRNRGPAPEESAADVSHGRGTVSRQPFQMPLLQPRACLHAHVHADELQHAAMNALPVLPAAAAAARHCPSALSHAEQVVAPLAAAGRRGAEQLGSSSLVWRACSHLSPSCPLRATIVG